MTTQLHRAMRSRRRDTVRPAPGLTLTQRLTHELGDALTVVVGYARLVGDDHSTSDAVRRDMAELVSAAERGAALTHSLLAARVAELDCGVA